MQLVSWESRCGKRSMLVTAGERLLADVEHHVRLGIDTSRPARPQMLARSEVLLRGDAAGDAVGVPHARPRPHLLIGLPGWVCIVRGDGVDDVLGLTDGTTMAGAEFLNRFVASADIELEAAVFHSTQGAFNRYRTSRLANSEQSDLARPAMPSCAQPFCPRGADDGEIHYVTLWARGGQTNLANLVPLCSYHNHVNDDNPSREPRKHRNAPRETGMDLAPRVPGSPH